VQSSPVAHSAMGACAMRVLSTAGVCRLNGTAALDETRGLRGFYCVFYFSSLLALLRNVLLQGHRVLDKRKKDSASSFARSNRGCRPGRGSGTNGSGSSYLDLHPLFPP
jgi:hypothetical protein